MGHYLYILKIMIQQKWEEGVKSLVQSATSKVIFVSSVTTIDDFLDMVDVLRATIEKLSEISQELTALYLE